MPLVTLGADTSGNFWMLASETPPLPFNPFPELPLYGLGGDWWLVDDRSVDYPGLQTSLAEAPAPPGLNGGAGGEDSDPPPPAYAYTTNDLWLEITGYTNCTASLVIHRPWNDSNGFHDLFYTTNLTAPINWQFLRRCVATNVSVSDLGDAQGSFRLGQTNGDLTVTTDVTPLEMAQLLVPPWVTLTNVSFAGSNVARGTFAGGHGCGLPSEAGVILSTGYITNGIGANGDNGDWAASRGSTLGSGADADLSRLVGDGPTLDAAVLEFDLISTNSFVLQFRYVFASEEYPEWISEFNDPMAVFVTTNLVGTNWIIDPTNNIALVPRTNTPVSVNTISGGYTNINGSSTLPSNPQFYMDNKDPSPAYSAMLPYAASVQVFRTQYDGMTVLLTAQIPVCANVTTHFKIAIADYAGARGDDRIYDSAIFLETWQSWSCCHCQ